MAKATIDIDGMTCDHCVGSVTKILKGFDGVSGVNVSLTDNKACLEYDEEKTSLLEITKAIEEDGYEIKGTH